MNERIRELWQQATPIDESRIVDGWYKPYIALQYAGEPTRHTFTEPELEKFAELIVKECAEIAVFKDSGTIATADVAGYMAAGRSIAARLIKEHFGVEE